MSWNIAAEIIAALIVVVIFINSRYAHSMPSPRERLFRLILLYSFFSFAINIITIITIEYYYYFSRTFIYIANSAYFIFYPLITTLFIIYVVLYIYEQTPRESISQQKVIFKILFIVNAIYMAIVVINIFDGSIFYLDEFNRYYRGPLNKSPIVLSAITIVGGSIIAFNKRKYLDWPFFQASIFAAVISLSIVMLQTILPNVLLTGSALAITALTFYLNFQTNKLSIDSLTSYPNRETFLANLAIIAKKKDKQSVYIIGLDNYKRIRETVGQRRANTLFKNVADKLNSASNGGQLYRYGDDELALIIKTDDERATTKAIIEMFREPWQVNGISTRLTASTAILRIPLEYESVTDIVTLLNNTLATASKATNLDYVVCDTTILNSIKRKNKIVDLLVNENCSSFCSLVYQPIFSLENNEFYAAEALIRMQAEDLNNVSPAEFIPLAEELGVIDKLGMWVFEEVLKFLSSLEEQNIEIPKISINFSAYQFLTENLVEQTALLLEKYQINGDRITFELTESALITTSFDKIYEIMNSLRNLGIEFYIDDFGSGYSNLSYILSLPIKFIKLDKTLLWGADGSKRRLEFLENLIEVTQKVGFIVVVEGVENQDQLNLIRKTPCKLAQGFYLSPPLVKDEFEKRLSEGISI